MVEVVSGNQLGLVNSSVSLLGGRGGVGNALLGQNGDQVFVNAATGNLIVQSSDEVLDATGQNLALIRTYNSQGLFNDDNGDNWRLSVDRRVYGLTGTVNTAGGTITKAFGDGTEVVYTYNTTLSAYVAKDGSNANDTLSWNTSTSQWTWTNGTSLAREVYNSTGQMLSSVDLNGNTTTYTYTGSYLTKIVDASGQTTFLDYTGNNLSDIRVVSNSVTQTRTRYTYDTSNRLQTVTVDLTPTNTADSVTYTTTYTYDGTSNRVASITQGDGTTISFAYQLINGAYRLYTYTDGTGNTTTFNYVTALTGSSATPVDLLAHASAITVGSPSYYTVVSGDTWAIVTQKVYGSSDAAAVSKLQSTLGSPALTAGAHLNVPMMLTYTPASASRTIYQQTTITSPQGQVTTINADTQGRLSSTVSPTVGTGSLETDFGYDGAGNVSTITDDPAGRHLVTTLQYDSNGNLLLSRDAAGNTVTRTYGAQNRLLTETTYTVPDPTGAGETASSGPQTTRYAYDGAGNLRFTATPQGEVIEYRYDTAGRRTSQIIYSASTYNVGALATYTTPLTEMQLIVWTAAQGQAQVPVELTTYAYDFRGNLTSSTAYTSATAVGATGANFISKDIGSPSPAGSTTQASGTFTVKGGGVDVYGTADTFQFDYQSFSGDGSIIARVATETTQNTFVKAGVMIRDSLAAGAMNMFAMITPGNGSLVTYRNATNGSTPLGTHGSATATAPYWVKLTRVGNVFTAYSSPDGQTWTQMGQATIAMGTNVYIGLAVTSHQSGTLATATIDNVSVIGGSSVAPTGPSVTTYTYDQRGLLLQKLDPRAVANPGQYVTNYTYDGLGRPLTTIRWTPTGNVTTSANVYTDSTKTATVTLANGTVSTSTFDAAGHLLSVAQANGATALGTTAYKYDTNGQLRRVTDPDGNSTDYLYDAAGRKQFVITGAGDLTEYVYDPSSNLVETIHYATATNRSLLSDTGGNPLASGSVNLTTLRSAAEGNTAGDIVTRSIYDSANRLVYSIDGAGGVTAYTYDGASQLTSTLQYAKFISISRSVGVLAYTPGSINGTALQTDAADRFTRYFYDADGRSAGLLDAAGYLTQNFYDAAGNVNQSIAYATITVAANRATGTLATLIPALDAVNDRVTYYFYDGQNRRVGVIDPLKFLTQTTYDAAGNVSQVIRYPNPVSWTGTPTLAAVLPSNTTGANITAYTYDELNHVLSVTLDQLGKNIKTSYQYDAVGTLHMMIEGVGSSNPRTTTYGYDGLGHKTSESVKLGLNYSSVDQGNDLTQYRFDAAGNLTRKIDGNGNSTWYVYDADNRVAYAIDALGDVTQNTYDDNGNITSTRQFAKTVTTTTFGDVVTLPQLGTPATDAADRLEQVIYDAAGRAQYLIDAAGGVVQKTYDPEGEVVQTLSYANAVPPGTYTTAAALTAVLATNALADRASRFVYDALGRVRFVLDALGGVSESQYDGLGNISQTTTYATACSNTGIQTLSSMTSWASANSVAVSDRTTRYWYDTQGRVVLSVNSGGFVTRVNYNDTTLTKDTIISAKAVSIPPGSTLAQAQALIQTTTDDQHTLINFDTLGRIVTQTDGAVGSGLSRIQQWQYDAVGNKIQYTDASGTITTYTYDSNNRLQTKNVDPTGLNIRTAYQYDSFGNVLVQIEGYQGANANPRTTTYTYDTLGRASTETVALGLGQGSAVTTYKYDAKGNLTRRIDAKNNSTWYVYNAENRLIDTIDALGGVTQKNYDAFGSVISTTRFTNAVSTSGFGNVVTPAQFTAPTAVPATDRMTQTVYDQDGRALYTIDPMGEVIQNTYDAMGNVTQTVAYRTPALVMTYTTVSQIASAVSTSVDDHLVRNVYDSLGELRYGIDGEGNVVQNQYNAEGLVSQSTQYYGSGSSITGAPSLATMNTWATSNVNANDRTTRFWYDTASRQVLTVDAAGYATQTNYNDAALTKETVKYATPVTIAAGATTATAAAALTASAANDQHTLITFDRAGRTLIENDGYGSTHQTSQSWRYDEVGNKIQYTNQNGAVWSYTYDANHRLQDELDPAVSVTTVAVVSGQLQPTTTAGVRLDTHMVYDAMGNVTSRTEAYGRSEARATSFGYDALGRQTSTTYPPMSVYNSAGDDPARAGTAVVRTETSVSAPTSSTIYNTLGDAVVNINVNGNASHKIYDRVGRVRYEIDAMNFVTEHHYDAFGNEDSLTRYAKSVTPGTGTLPAATAEWTAAQLGSPATDPADRTINKSYDHLNRLTLLAQPSAFYYLPASGSNPGSGGSNGTTVATTSYDYDAFGELIRQRQLADPVNGLYATTFHYYDARGLEVANVVEADAATAKYYLTTMQYDSRGNLKDKLEYVTAIGAPTFPSATPPAAPTASADDRHTSYTYDALDRMQNQTVYGVSVGTITGTGPTATATTTATNQVTSYQYDGVGNKTAVTDQLGGTTYTYYDALGRTTAVAQPSENVDGGGSATLIPLTVMNRDAFGDLSSETQYAGGAATASVSSYTVGTAPASTSKVIFSWVSPGETPEFGYRLHGTSTWLYVTPVYNGTAFTVTMPTLSAGNYDFTFDVTHYRPNKGVTAVVASETGTFTISGNTATITSQTLVSGTVSGVSVNAVINSAQDRTTYAVYDNFGHATYTQDPNSSVRQASYDKSGNLAKQWQLVVDPNNPATTQAIVTINKYDALNHLVDVITPERQDTITQIAETFSKFNAFGEITNKGTYAYLGTQVLPETYDYDAQGRLWRKTVTDGTHKTSTVYLYDPLGNQTAVITSQTGDLSTVATSGDALTPPFSTMRQETRYDLMGHAVEQRSASFTPAPPQEQVSNGITFGTLTVAQPPGASYQATTVNVFGSTVTYYTFNPTTWANGGGYIQDSPPSSTNQFGTYHRVAQQQYNLVQSGCVYWNLPTDQGVTVTFTATDSGGTAHILPVVQLTSTQQGVDISSLANGNYTYTVSYTRPTDSTPYAVSQGSFTVNESIVTTLVSGTTQPPNAWVTLSWVAGTGRTADFAYWPASTTSYTGVNVVQQGSNWSAAIGTLAPGTYNYQIDMYVPSKGGQSSGLVTGQFTVAGGGVTLGTPTITTYIGSPVTSVSVSSSPPGVGTPTVTTAVSGSGATVAFSAFQPGATALLEMQSSAGGAWTAYTATIDSNGLYFVATVGSFPPGVLSSWNYRVSEVYNGEIIAYGTGTLNFQSTATSTSGFTNSLATNQMANISGSFGSSVTNPTVSFVWHDSSLPASAWWDFSYRVHGTSTWTPVAASWIASPVTFTAAMGALAAGTYDIQFDTGRTNKAGIDIYSIQASGTFTVSGGVATLGTITYTTGSAATVNPSLPSSGGTATTTTTLQWARPGDTSVYGSFQYRVHGSTGGYSVINPVPMDASNFYATIANLPANTTYDYIASNLYDHTNKAGTTITTTVDQVSGTFVTTGPSVTVQSQTHTLPAAIPVSLSGNSLVWSRPIGANESLTVRVLNSANQTLSYLLTVTGSSPNYSASLVGIPTGNYTYTIAYADSSTGVYTFGQGSVTVSTAQQAVSNSAAAGVGNITNFSDGTNGTLYWAPPANAGDTVTFYYRQLGATTWASTLAVTAHGSTGCQVSLAGLSGTIEYEVVYTASGQTSSYIIANGRTTIVQTPSWTGAATYTPVTPSPVTARVQQSYDRWGDVLDVTDASLNKTSYHYNVLGQVDTVTLPTTATVATNGTTSGTNQNLIGTLTNVTATEQNYYDVLGRLIGTKDALGNINSSTYNSNGLKLTEAHADGGNKQYVYDAFGDQIQVTEAQTSSTSSQTSSTSFRSRMIYDNNGQLLALARELVAGGFATSIATDLTSTSASGVVETDYVYDAAGRRASQTNGLLGSNGTLGSIKYTYDLQGNVVKTLTPRGFAETYRYDLNGNKTLDTNANGDSLAWAYDYMGTLLTHTDLDGVVTNYTYTTLSGGGGFVNDAFLVNQRSTIGGATAQNITYGYDEAGHLTSIADGGVGQGGLLGVTRNTTYGYDAAGRRSRETVVVDGLTHQDEQIVYDQQNRISQITDIRYRTNYYYDAAGNRTDIDSWYIDYAGNKSNSTLYYTYDQMNRVAISQGANVSGKVGITSTQGISLEYDLKGERTAATQYGQQLHDSLNSSNGAHTLSFISANERQTYTYDGIGDLLNTYDTESTDTNGTATAPVTYLTDAKSYDKAQRLTSETTYSYSAGPSTAASVHNTANAYDNDGRLSSTTTLLNGNPESYTSYGDATQNSPTTVSATNPFTGGSYSVSWSGAWGPGYDAAGFLHGYVQQVFNSSGSVVYSSTDAISYRNSDSYQETGESINSQNGVGQGPQSGQTTYTYNVDNQLVNFVDTRDANKDRTFADDAAGHALTVVQGEYGGSGELTTNQAFQEALSNSGGYNTTKSQHFFFALGQQVGTLGQLTQGGNFVANFDVNYTPVSPSYPAAMPSQVVVQQGDTLGIIAARIYGDANLWYLIAAENGLTGDATTAPPVGSVLRIPSSVVSVSNTGSTFKPYSASAAIGNTTPTQPIPPPPKSSGGCGILGEILIIVVAIVVTIYTAGAAAEAFGAVATTGGLGSAGLTAVTGGLIGGGTITAAGAAGAAAAAAGIGAAVGSAVSQGVAIATGLQSGFNWNQVAIGAITGAVGSEGVISGAFGKVAGAVGGGYLGAAAAAVTSEAITQGISIGVGLQQSFNWTAVAQAAVAAPVAMAVGHVLPNTTPEFARNVLKGAASVLVREAVGGKVQPMEVLADAFGDALANSLVEGASNATLPDTARGASAPTAAGGGGSYDASDHRSSTLDNLTLNSLTTTGDLTSNPTGYLGSTGPGVTPDQPVAAASDSSPVEQLPEVVVESPHWNNVEEALYQQVRDGFFGIGGVLDEDRAATQARTLARFGFNPLAGQEDARGLLLNYSPVGAAIATYNLGVKAAGGLATAGYAPFVGIDRAVDFQNSFNQKWGIDGSSSLARAIGATVQPYVSAVHGGLEGTLGVGGDVFVSAAAEFALDAAAIAGTGSSLKGVSTLLDRDVQVPFTFDTSLSRLNTGLPIVPRSILRPIDEGHIYEGQIRDLYSQYPVRAPEYTAEGPNGMTVTREADYAPLINGDVTIVEAKYTADWKGSIYNPDSGYAATLRKGGLTAYERTMAQARDYNLSFNSIMYHSNSQELIDFYKGEFQKAGYDNIQFTLTPYKK